MEERKGSETAVSVTMSFLMHHIKQLPKIKSSTSTATASDPHPRQEHRLDHALDIGVVGTPTLVSPSTDAEYDKLTVRWCKIVFTDFSA